MTEFDYEDRLTITTPEGIELRLTLAGVGSRFLAASVDGLIEAVLLVACALLVFLTRGFGAGMNVAAAIYVVVAFLIFWGYDVAFEVLASGRTPGKRWNGLRVVREGGQPIGFLASATRNLLRLIDWLPSLYLVGMVSVLVSAKNQRLGDIVAGTIVVREVRGAPSRLSAAAAATGALGAAQSEAVWDVGAITAEELATVRKFLERRAEIDADARYELASTMAARLRPKVAGAPLDTGAEPFLEQLVALKLRRG
jgi:uncharacterized RDD family membrane protein YckC